MITADQIRGLRCASPDYQSTEELKKALQNLRIQRDPYYLATEEFDEIFHWKLGSQYGRQAEKRAKNSDIVYRAVSEAVFKIESCSFEYECEVRFRLLEALPGIGIPVASAVLALIDPERYCVIDFRGWRAVFEEDRGSFTIGQYIRYRNEVARLAKDLGWSVQEADLAIWEYDRRHH